MNDLTPKTLQGLSDAINNKIYEFGEMLDEKTHQMLDKVDEKMDELIDKVKGMFGGLLGKASDTVKAPLSKSTPTTPRSKQMFKEKFQSQQLSASVKRQVTSLNMGEVAKGCSTVHSCSTPNAPRISAGVGGFGMGY